MYQDPRRFFARELLLLIIGFIGIVIGAIFTGTGNAGIIIAIALNMGILLLMFIMTITSIVHFIRFLSDKDNKNLAGLYILNGVLSTLIFVGFSLFYLFLILAGTIILAPLT